MTALFAGGAEKQYRYIMEAISNDFNVKVLLLNKPLEGQDEQTRAYIEKHRRIKFYQLNGNVLNKGRIGYIKLRLEKIIALFIQWRWLKKYLKHNKVDIVMFTYVTQLLMVPLFNQYGTKTLFNERNTGRQILDKFFKRYLLKKCSKIISNSKYASDYIQTKIGNNVEIYKNGIEIKTILKKSHYNFNIVVPARINKIKNQLIVVQSLLKLKSMLVNKEYSRIQCFFAGACEDEAYLKKIKEIIDKEQLNIHIMGYVSDMDSLYGNADLIILPSYEEGTPNVLLESYMYKIDALISKIPMNMDCCRDESIMFSPDNADELADKIKDCINNDRNEQYYNNNYKFLIDNYGLKSMKDRYISLFMRL